MSAPIRNLIGERFGKLTVTRITPRRTKGGRNVYWLCQCDCGNSTIVNSSALRSGGTQSCGCRTHYSEGSSYRVWTAMLQRCYNANDRGYKDYGGRGIKVCDRWHTFTNFLTDMGERPKDKQIDRIDNDGDYKSSNCRWVTPKENANNRRPRRLTKLTLKQVRAIRRDPRKHREIAADYNIDHSNVTRIKNGDCNSRHV